MSSTFLVTHTVHNKCDLKTNTRSNPCPPIMLSSEKNLYRKLYVSSKKTIKNLYKVHHYPVPVYIL